MVRTYERVRHISTGRFGTSSLARVSGEGHFVMVKNIDLGRMGCMLMVDQLIDEVKAVATLQHPFLVRVRESFLEQGHVFIITDYQEGGDVAGRIRNARAKGTQLGVPCALRWYAEAALAVGYLHGRGVVHRDLRTRRLHLDMQDHALVSGVALSPLLARSLSTSRPDIEAVRYLAPELVAGGAAHAPATDLWSLGVVLYEMVALRPPYDDAHPRGLAQKILERPAPALYLPDGSAAASAGTSGQFCARICADLLQREPQQRPPAHETLRGDEMKPVLRSLVQSPGDAAVGLLPAAALQPSESTKRSVAGRRAEGGVLGPMLPHGSPVTPRGLRQAGELMTGGAPGRTLQGPRAAQLRIGGKRSKGPLDARYAPMTPSATTIWSAQVSHRDSIGTMTEKVVEVAAAAAAEEVLAKGPVIISVEFLDQSFLLTQRGESKEGVSTEAWDLPPFSHQRAFPTFQ